MPEFPRTMIEDLSVSRMLIGCNWFLGFSHTSKARNNMILSLQTRETLADIIEVFMNAGVDTIYGARPDRPLLLDAIKDAEERTGRKCIIISLVQLDPNNTPEADSENQRLLDSFAAIGCSICLPHQCCTDAMVDRRTRSIPGMERLCAMIRERGMIPGLSTHMPETPIYADETGLDVGTYIQIYNAIGFLMQIEVDWVHRMIWERKKPVIAIKPMAAGRLHPLPGMAFAWATLRPQDMVCVGTLTADEARELLDLSWALFERRAPTADLQRTMSKASIIGK